STVVDGFAVLLSLFTVGTSYVPSEVALLFSEVFTSSVVGCSFLVFVLCEGVTFSCSLFLCSVEGVSVVAWSYVNASSVAVVLAFLLFSPPLNLACRF
ncbi:hypothetical protein, partial [Staphylococcus pseudintermedius]|uniref:hypothetical protein n=1 Tax=Staphylococcus pseudintermedius TaxID=283734 RepID=UPI001E388DF0